MSPREDPDRLVIDVGRKIAELRQRSGRTQVDLARALRCAPQYVQRLEAGRNVTLHSLAKIANALGVPAWELLTPTSYRRPTRAGRPKATSRGGRSR